MGMLSWIAHLEPDSFLKIKQKLTIMTQQLHTWESTKSS